MRPESRFRLVLLVAATAIGAGCVHLRRAAPSPADTTTVGIAPDSFDVEFVTTKGTMLVRARRAWSPLGVDRFHHLARVHFFDSAAFFRTIGNFVAQFGLNGDPAVNAAWRGKSIQDDTIRVVNQRGTLSFARGGANSRSTQLFFNLVDNTPRLDTLNAFGFPPIAQIIQGIEVLDQLNHEYGGVRGGASPPASAQPSQDSITRQGNAYLRRHFPRLDYIVTARIVADYGHRR